MCRTASVDLFYPVLYRVQIERIPAARQTVANSGRLGSREVLVRDLRESEFDLLFLDNDRDGYFPQMVIGEMEGSTRTHPMAALAFLETKADA